MIHFGLSVAKYDELVRQYETILVDYINTTMAKAKALGSIAPTQSEGDSLAAKIFLRRIRRVRFVRYIRREQTSLLGPRFCTLG
jgi:hypothetical protein